MPRILSTSAPERLTSPARPAISRISVAGIFPPEEAEKFKPEGHRRPHKKHEHRGKHTEQAAEVLPLKRAQQVALHAA